MRKQLHTHLNPLIIPLSVSLFQMHDFQEPHSIQKNYRKLSSPSLALHVTCYQEFWGSTLSLDISIFYNVPTFYPSVELQALHHGGVGKGRQTNPPAAVVINLKESSHMGADGNVNADPSPFHSNSGVGPAKLPSNSVNSQSGEHCFKAC